MSVASGEPWWGMPCEKMPTLYINFELHDWAFRQRVEAILAARTELNCLNYFHVWNLRGHAADLSELRLRIEDALLDQQFDLIILDPAYKVLGDRDENSNGEIAGLMNELERLAQYTGAAIVVAHHFAKGNSASKDAADRMSGAGSWVRDPDSIIILTPHEEENCYTASFILRNLPRIPECVVAWEYPLMKLVRDLNPEALRRPQAKNKVCRDSEFLEGAVGSDGHKSYSAIIARASERLQMSKATASRYLNRLVEAGLISKMGVFYTKTHDEHEAN
jgi:DNA-binding transcriptional ArsR family regulator